MPFKKGQNKLGGRKPGVPNKVTNEIKEIAREIISSDDYLESLRLRLVTGVAPPAVEVAMHHYAWGRPKEIVSFESEGKISVEMFRAAAAFDDGDDDSDDAPPPKKPPARARKKKKKKALARR